MFCSRDKDTTCVDGAAGVGCAVRVGDICGILVMPVMVLLRGTVGAVTFCPRSCSLDLFLLSRSCSTSGFLTLLNHMFSVVYRCPLATLPLLLYPRSHPPPQMIFSPAYIFRSMIVTEYR